MFNQPPFRNSARPPNMGNIMKKGRRLIPIAIILVIIGLMSTTSFYSLNSGEEAVVTRFGKWVRTEEDAGLKFKLPLIETAHIVNVQGVRRMEFGSTLVNGIYEDIPEEALMLTGETSRVNGLVNADWVIQFRISDSYNYLFKVEDPDTTLHSITQAAYRRVVASYPLDDILTDKKDDIQREILLDLQEICNKYEMGIEIIAVQLQDASPPDEVREAFLDVTRSLDDRISMTNEAERYRNEELPRAQGRATAAINEAESYKERRVNEARGAVERYTAIEEEFRNQPDITRTRLYLEMIREVMPRIQNVYFVDPSSGNLIEILNLGQ